MPHEECHMRVASARARPRPRARPKARARLKPRPADPTKNKFQKKMTVLKKAIWRAASSPKVLNILFFFWGGGFAPYRFLQK